MQKKFSRGRTAIALLLACSLLAGTAVANNADIDDFDDGVVEDVQVRDFQQTCIHLYICMYDYTYLCMCVYVDWRPVVTGTQKVHVSSNNICSRRGRKCIVGGVQMYRLRVTVVYGYEFALILQFRHISVCIN